MGCGGATKGPRRATVVALPHIPYGEASARCPHRQKLAFEMPVVNDVLAQKSVNDVLALVK